MKKKNKSSKYGMNENWLIRTPSHSFSIAAIEAMQKEGDNDIAIFFHGPISRMNFRTIEERDEFFDWLVRCQDIYLEASRKQKDTSNAMARAQLEIQNRIAGHVTHNH